VIGRDGRRRGNWKGLAGRGLESRVMCGIICRPENCCVSLRADGEERRGCLPERSRSAERYEIAHCNVSYSLVGAVSAR